MILKLIKWFIPKLAFFSKNLAVKTATYFFLTPFRVPFSEKEKQYLQSLEKSVFTINGKKTWVYQDGTFTKTCLFIHGWAGKGVQVLPLVSMLKEKGYRVICFDAPAHGYSEGKQSSIPEFTDLVKTVQENYGTIDLVIGPFDGRSSIL